MSAEQFKLTGKDLSSYLEIHRDEFDGNGDALCVAAGYGIKGEDGIEKCDFKGFIQALSASLGISEDNGLEEI